MKRYRIEAQEFYARELARTQWMTAGLQIVGEAGPTPPSLGELSPMALTTLGVKEIGEATAKVRRCSCGCAPHRWRVIDADWHTLAEFREHADAVEFATSKYSAVEIEPEIAP